MLTRALIVLLLVLNLGVALWWANRPGPPAPPTETPSPGVERLQLVSEQGAAPPATAAEPPAIDRCLRLGPFATADAAATVQTRLQPRAVQVRPHRDYAGTARSWKVLLPPAADIAAAEAAAARIAAAGFRDWFVIRDGEDERAVALGLYRNESAARERADALKAAGFAVELVPVGAGPARHWLDVAAPATLAAADLQAATGAPGIEPIDCAGFEPAGPAVDAAEGGAAAR